MMYPLEVFRSLPLPVSRYHTGAWTGVASQYTRFQKIQAGVQDKRLESGKKWKRSSHLQPNEHRDVQKRLKPDAGTSKHAFFMFIV